LEEIGINVYASVPLSETFSKNVTKNIGWKKTKNVENYGFLAVENPADLAIEAIRGLRTSLHFAMMEARNNVLMISGASPNSGKSFISSNLAAVISQSGKKVLLIDTDLRKGYLHRVFNVNNTAGLSDYLSGKLDVKNIILKSKVIDFDFISRGTTPPNPAELLMHKRFQDLVSWANENYD
ncbi:tyrosine-protein kinase, partial [Escherichia coli]